MSQPSITNCPFTFGPAVYGWYIRSVYRFHYRLFFTFLHHVYLIQVTIALRFHLFPFRTEKLSSVTPMVLRNSGRVGSRRFFQREALVSEDAGAFLFLGLFCLPCLNLPCFACFSFLCFACFLGVSRFLVRIILILVKCFFFLSFQDIISYRLKECYASVYLPLSSVYFPVLLFISFFLVILLLSLRNKTGEKRYFL